VSIAAVVLRRSIFGILLSLFLIRVRHSVEDHYFLVWTSNINLLLIKHFELFQSLKYQLVFALRLVSVVRK
jgi:hypothetical protein